MIMKISCRHQITSCILALSVCVLSLRPIDGRQSANLQDLKYRNYPRRSEDEAAVIEWGSSAIISAIDAAVAHFGPQTSQAALMEVETMPVLASPVHGRWEKSNVTEDDNEDPYMEKVIQKLDNADEVHGNLVVMTNLGGLSGVEMAQIAQLSGAAALLVVNVDEERPDDIYRLPAEEGSDKIDIPVAMISLNSANVLTTATVTDDMKQEDIINNGMPERVRLYAGGDRPFFEDVEASEPTVYIIHNLLTKKECDSLIERAASIVSPVVDNDSLQFTQDYQKFVNVKRAMLWDGILKTPERKSIEERVEQVTGFPAEHYSDFIVDELEPGSYWQPHYDTIDGSVVPIVTIIIFLSSLPTGGEIVYPSTSGDPLVATINGGKLPRLMTVFYDKMIAQFGKENGDLYFDYFFIVTPFLLLIAVGQVVVKIALQKWKESNEALQASAPSKKKKNPVKQD